MVRPGGASRACEARAHLVRYADDAVMLFEYEEDARRVMAVLPKRFGKYGLTLHPDKTRLVPFQAAGPDAALARWRRRARQAGHLRLPRLHHPLGQKPHDGNWVVKTRTAADRFRRTLKSISQWCKEHRHEPLEMQQRALNQKLRGHYGYYGRTGNRARLWALLHGSCRRWWRWLRRRSQRGLSWDAMNRLLQRYPLPTPRLRVPRVANAVSRRAGCGNPARPDPWGPGRATPGATRPHARRRWARSH